MKSKNRKSKARIQRSDEFKAEALKLADTIGATAAAEELDINPNQIYTWRSKRNNKQHSSERKNELATENARLKRELAESQDEVQILRKATAYFAKHDR